MITHVSQIKTCNHRFVQYILYEVRLSVETHVQSLQD